VSPEPLSGPPAKVLLVGFGFGGSVFHAPFIDAEPRLELATVVTSDLRRRDEVVEHHPSATVAVNLDEALASDVDYSLAVVTTPNATHVPIAETLLARGIPLVVDKPVAPTAEQARQLGRLAEEHGAAVVPFQNRRYDADFRTVERLLEAGPLGTLARFESRYERWKPEVDASSPRGWKEDSDPAAANGIIYDLGAHLVDQAVVLFGHPERVYAEIATRRPGARVNDDVFIALSYPGGLEAHLWMNAAAALPGPRFRLLGSVCGFEKYGMDTQENALLAGALPRSPCFGDEPAGSWGVLGTPESSEPVPSLTGDYGLFYGGVAHWLYDGAEPPVQLGDSILGLEIIEAALRSAASGQVVGLDPAPAA